MWVWAWVVLFWSMTGQASACLDRHLMATAAEETVRILVDGNPGVFVDTEESIQGARSTVFRGLHKEREMIVTAVKMQTPRGMFIELSRFAIDRRSCQLEFLDSRPAVNLEGKAWFE